MRLSNSDKIQIVSMMGAVILTVLGAVWHMSASISRIETKITSMEQTMSTGFKHTDRAMNTVKADVRQLTQHCCSEIYAMMKSRGEE